MYSVVLNTREPDKKDTSGALKKLTVLLMKRTKNKMRGKKPTVGIVLNKWFIYMVDS